MLHIKKQPWYGRPLIRSFQSLLRNTVLGNFFFRAVATPETVKSILCQVSSVMTWLTASSSQLMLEMARATRKINEKDKTVKLEFLLVMNIDL
ncbi:unnamed protein product [Ilex paraguariensis]|uniref:Uncharacterized protein n=1 Tax=Ilex paraguariensis TaxID=185542 RepID=A0ABC8SDM3_9AQUA